MKLGGKKKAGGIVEMLKNFVLEQVESGKAAGAGKDIKQRPKKLDAELRRALGGRG